MVAMEFSKLAGLRRSRASFVTNRKDVYIICCYSLSFLRINRCDFADVSVSSRIYYN